MSTSTSKGTAIVVDLLHKKIGVVSIVILVRNLELLLIL